jgi:glycerophosphoryl diester phosphodiesterase
MSCLNIAHRGGAGLWPENSLAAFRSAAALGADGAELDVQLSRDGEVIVFHDYRLKPEICRDAEGNWLRRPTPRIKDLTFRELRGYDIGRADPGTDYARAHPDLLPAEGERIPLLSEVIAIAKMSAKPFTLFVELKTSFADRTVSALPEELAEATVAVLKSHNYLDHAIFVGFDWPGLLHVKKIEPHAECWFTTLDQRWFGEGEPPPESDPPAAPSLAALRHWAKSGTSPWAGGFDAVNHSGSILRAIKAAGGDGWFPTFTDATDSSVAEARDLGLKMGAWTVDEPKDMRALMERGCDAICTDRPDILLGIQGGMR